MGISLEYFSIKTPRRKVVPVDDKDKILEDIEPLLVDLADAFDLAAVQASTVIDANFPNASDGYLRRSEEHTSELQSPS